MNTRPNEVWQDGEGCLMVPCDTEGREWWVFAVGHPISIDNPNIVHPLTRVIDEFGNVEVDHVNYPWVTTTTTRN